MAFPQETAEHDWQHYRLRRLHAVGDGTCKMVTAARTRDVCMCYAPVSVYASVSIHGPTCAGRWLNIISIGLLTHTSQGVTSTSGV